MPRRGLVERSRQGHPPEGSDGGVLAASGLVAGEGLAGVLVAAFVALGVAPKGRPPFVAGLPGEALTTLGILAVCALCIARARSVAPEGRQRARTARRNLAGRERGLAWRSSGEARTTSRETSA